MAIKNFNVSLDEDVVKEARKIFDSKGQKLSPVINNYLKDLIKEDEDGCVNSGA